MTSPAATPDPLAIIRDHGDVLERAIFADRQFSDRLYGYAQVWAEFVLPNRLPTNPGRVTDAWMPLAQCNYTALVRCSGVKLAYDRIIDACAQVLDGRPPGTELLSLHEAAASFFANAGATIENLGKCFEVKPVCSPIENYVRSRRSELDSIYDRRSQFVHQIIVPCFLTRHDDETLEPALNLDCLRFKQTTWVAPSIESVRTVDEYFRDTYEEFLAAVSDTWMHLFSKIKDAQISTKPAGPQNSVQVMPPIEWNQTSGSG